jgi:hypothetical protein
MREARIGKFCAWQLINWKERDGQSGIQWHGDGTTTANCFPDNSQTIHMVGKVLKDQIYLLCLSDLASGLYWRHLTEYSEPILERKFYNRLAKKRDFGEEEWTIINVYISLTTAGSCET